MNIEPWDAWKEIERVRSQADQLWNRLFEKLDRPFSFVPEADVVETPTEIRLYLSLPGMVEDDVDIMASDKELVVRGERYEPHDCEAAQNSSIECRYGFFERRFQLEYTITSLRAQYDAGILTIVVPKGGGDE